MMARIDRLEQKDAVRTSIHGPVDATFHVFEADGVRYLQIDTYGSAERQIMGKTSQSIQFGEKGLAQLRQILEKLA